MSEASEMVASPSGGRLIQNVIEEPHEDLPMLEIGRRYALDAEKIGIGAYSPLEGFMGSSDLENVLYKNELNNGLPWTIPIILPVMAPPEEGERVYLNLNGNRFGFLEVEEVFRFNKKEIAEKVYSTLSPEHPGVAQVMSEPETAVSGKVWIFRRVSRDKTPAETREIFKKLGWRDVAGYQTRNPPHRAHEYVIRVAMEFVDGVFIHPVVGELKNDDFPPEAIVEAYDYFVKNYLPKNRALLDTLTIPMRYAGPKAAVFYAIIRRNYGCTHFVVGRDMAGVGNFYDPYGAQKMLREMDLGVEIIPVGEAFYCDICEGIVSERSCDHNARKKISMTLIRKLLSQGEEPPREIIRPQIASILKRYYKNTESLASSRRG